VNSMGQFFEMGGYAGYVWPAFVIVLVVMAVLWVASRRGCRNSEHTLAALRKNRQQQGIDAQ
jgi:heme exporter protein D